MATVVDGSYPASKVKSTSDPTITALVVTNPDGSDIGGAASTLVTPNFASEVAGSTTVIPSGAIDASILILTGTGTINGVSWPAGTPWNEPNKLAATVTLILGTPGTAIIYYGT